MHCSSVQYLGIQGVKGLVIMILLSCSDKIYSCSNDIYSLMEQIFLYDRILVFTTAIFSSLVAGKQFSQLFDLRSYLEPEDLSKW